MDEQEGSSRRKLPKIDNNDGKGENVSINHTEKKSKLLDLPKEVWYSILSWVPQKDKVLSRLVCKEWKQNIDLHATFHVKLHQNVRQDFLQRMLELRITSIEFSSLSTDFNMEFAFPLLVKEIVISTNVNPVNFKKICQKFTCVQSLRFFSTHVSNKTFDSEDRQSSIELLRNLKQIKTIEIGIVTFEARQIWDCETFNVICCSAFELPFASLNSLSINLQLYHAEMFKFFEFIHTQRNTLEHLSARIECPRVVDQLNPNENFTTTQFAFKSLQVMRDPGSCQFCDQQLEHVWKKIIQQQECLTCLVVDLNSDFSVEEFVTLVRKNPNLQSLKIFGIHFDEGSELPDDIFDQSILVDILLEFSGNTYFIISANGEISELQFEFSVIDKLPTTLKKFTLKKCSVPRTQLLSGLKILRNLEELRLEDCLFRNGSFDLNFFLDILKAFRSEESNVQRFVFNGFKFPPEFDSNIPLWNRIVNIAIELDILSISGRCNSFPTQDLRGRLPDPVDTYDFRFNKKQIGQLVEKIEG